MNSSQAKLAAAPASATRAGRTPEELPAATGESVVTETGNELVKFSSSVRQAFARFFGFFNASSSSYTDMPQLIHRHGRSTIVFGSFSTPHT
jgi:hypothetical protein